MEAGLSGQPTKCRYYQYTATKGRCHGKHFLAFYICSAHWHHPANKTEPSLCGGDAALFYYYLFQKLILILLFHRDEKMSQCRHCSKVVQLVPKVNTVVVVVNTTANYGRPA